METSHGLRYNNLALPHFLLSDDGGDSWHLVDSIAAGHGANEMQLVELGNGSVLANSRSLSTGSRQARLALRSDDAGETWTPSTFVDNLPEPFNGCEGSIVSAGGAGNSSEPRTLYFSHPLPATNQAAIPKAVRALGGEANLTGRDHLTLWTSGNDLCGNKFSRPARPR